MQSGISASAELHTALQTLLTTPSQRGLLATIEKEAVVPLATIESSSSDFISDLSNLAPHLQPDAALYIFLRTDSQNGGAAGVGSLIAATYIPPTAPVRQKMLFASSRLQLLRDLGSEHFAENIFCTEASELSAEGWKRHVAHGEAENPLTQEEKDLEGIKEAEALEGRGTQGYGLVKAGRVMARFGEGVFDALSALRGNEEKGNLVQLRIDTSTEAIELVGVSDVNVQDLSSTISSTEPQYSFYRCADAAKSIVFISSCPSKASIKARMLYAASRRPVISAAEAEAGLKVEKKIEVTNPDEVTKELIEEEFRTEEVQEKKAFARPKRPGKR